MIISLIPPHQSFAKHTRGTLKCDSKRLVSIQILMSDLGEVPVKTEEAMRKTQPFDIDHLYLPVLPAPVAQAQVAARPERHWRRQGKQTMKQSLHLPHAMGCRVGCINRA
jgi:hypothetical protein